MADIMKILQQAQQMQGQLKKIQDELEARTVNAAAGGGMVAVEADGKGQIRKIKIDPTVVNPADVEMLEDLILVAVVEAQKKAADMAQEEMGKLAGGMDLPMVKANRLQAEIWRQAVAASVRYRGSRNRAVTSSRNRQEDGASADLSPPPAAGGAHPTARYGAHDAI